MLPVAPPARPPLARVPVRQGGLARLGARLGRLWKGYLILATALAGLMGAVMLTVQYFVLLPPFAWSAKSRRRPPGWQAARPADLDAQY